MRYPLGIILTLIWKHDTIQALRALFPFFYKIFTCFSAERRIIRKKIMSGESQTSAPISEGTAGLLSVIKCK